MSNNTDPSVPYTDILDDHTDAELERLTSDLATLYTAPAPDAAFAAALRARIERAPTPPPVAVLPPRRRLLGRRPLIAAAAAAVLAVAALGTALLLDRGSQSVSAQEILNRAQNVASGSAPMSVRSYHQRAAATHRERDATVTTTIETWYGGNGRVRIEEETRNAAGVTSTSGVATNPTQYWKFYTEGGQTYVHTGSVQGQAANTDEKLLPGNNAASIAEVLALYSRDRCPSSTVRQQGESNVAGRPVYVIEIAGAAACNTKSDAFIIDRSLISVDKEAFLPLKTEAFTADGTLLNRIETTSIEYNVTIPEATFTYTPPPGAIINPPDEKRESGPAASPSAETLCLKREHAAGRGSTAEATCRALATPTATPAP